MNMENQQQYENRSLSEAVRHMQEIEASPLSDRKEAAREFFEAMRDSPDLVAERLGWLFDGNYGYGEMLKARQIINAPRMNRRAALTHLIGIFEWMCPGKMGVEGWKKLTADQKKRLDKAIDIVIEAAEKEKAEEGW
jgi:hypothetical protein